MAVPVGNLVTEVKCMLGMSLPHELVSNLGRAAWWHFLPLDIGLYVSSQKLSKDMVDLYKDHDRANKHWC